MRWLQDKHQNNIDNLNNVRREASRHFRKKKEYPKAKINGFKLINKIKNSREINDFNKGTSLELI